MGSLFGYQQVVLSGAPGLYDGKCGNSIIYFLANRVDPDMCYDDVGTKILDGLADDLVALSALDFSSGAAGIGWGIEWLSQNSLIEVNTDDVLEDIDDVLYKAVIFSETANISIRNGTLGYLLYFMMRFKSVNFNTNRFRRIAHQECIVILSDDLRSKFEAMKCNARFANGYLSDADVINLGHLVVILSDLLLLKINIPTVEDVLYSAIALLEYLFVVTFDKPSTVRPSLLYLAHCYRICANTLNKNRWIHQSSGYLRRFSKFEYTFGDNSPILIVNEIMSNYSILKDERNIQVRIEENWNALPSISGVYGKLFLSKYLTKFPAEIVSCQDLLLFT